MTRLLADSSIWVDHIRESSDELAFLLRRRRILTHSLVIGEVAMGSIKHRAEFIAALDDQPRAIQAEDAEVMTLVDRHRLYGTGIGFIDAHLIASALLTPETKLWTRDRRLRETAERLGIARE